MFLEPLLFQEHLFGERRERRAEGGMYFTGAVELVELRVQDGRGTVWRGAVWCDAAYAGNAPYASRVGAVCYADFQAAEQHR